MSARDQKLLEIAGLNVSAAAKILRRSRQSVSRGVKSERSSYFRLHDFVTIHRELRDRDSFVADKFLQYVRENYPEFNAIEVRANATGIGELATAKEVWVICNSFEEIEHTAPELARGLIDFVLRKEKSVCHFIFSDDNYRALFEKRLNAECVRLNVECRALLLYHILPPLAFISANLVITSDKCTNVYALTEKGLEKVPELMASRMTRQVVYAP